MGDIRQEVDRLAIEVEDGRHGIKGRILRAAESSASPSDRARLVGVLATFYLMNGKVQKSIETLQDALSKADGLEAIVELTGVRVSIAIERGQLGSAKALADACLLETMDDEGEARALALFKSGLVAGYSGDPQTASRRWPAVLSLTQRPFYIGAARLNAAIDLLKLDRVAEAKEFLQVPPLVCSKRARGFWAITRAKLAAKEGDLEMAIEVQEEAIALYAHRGPIDRAQLTIDLVRFLHASGNVAGACAVATQAGRQLVSELEDERHMLAAAALAELVDQGKAASFSARALHQLRQTVTLEGRSSQRSGRSSRRR